MAGSTLLLLDTSKASAAAGCTAAAPVNCCSLCHAAQWKANGNVCHHLQQQSSAEQIVTSTNLQSNANRACKL